MNPLTRTNADAVGVRFNQWEQLVKTKIKDLEAIEQPKPSTTTLAVAADVLVNGV